MSDQSSIDFLQEKLESRRMILFEAQQILSRLVASRPPRSMGKTHDEALNDAQDFLRRHPPVAME